jgi:hypothetical protein
VAQLLHGISSTELTEWQAFFLLESEPPKQTAADLRASFGHLVKRKAK